MTLRYMLDTNIVSFIIKANNRILEHKIKSISKEQICISSITQAELLYGIARKPEATRLHREVHHFLNHIQILSWENDIAPYYAQIRADLEKKGQTIGAMDMLIASHAVAKNLTLVTNNIAEFKRVHGLIYDDWTI